MKAFRVSIILLAVLLSAVSCNKKDNSEIIAYNLDNVSNTAEIKLSDFMDDIHLVKLELVPEHPVSPYMNLWVGDNHILLITRKTVLQYTPDGIFVRELIKNGKGPEEFGEVDYYDVDEGKDVFFFYDHESPGRIRRIDLISGKLLKSIKLPGEERWLLAGFVVYNSRLLCFTNNFSRADYRYFYLSENGDIEYGCSKEAYLEDRPQISVTPYLNEHLGEVTYKQVRDTLFFLAKDTLEIDMIVRVDNYFDPGAGVNKGSSPQIILNGREYRLFAKTELEFFSSENGIGFEDYGTSYYLLNRKEGSITEAISFFADNLGIQLEKPEFKCNDGNAFVVIEAIGLMSLLEKAPNDTDKRVMENISSLKETINENDNPYLLIGKLK